MSAAACWDWLWPRSRCGWARACLPESLPRISEIGLNWNVVGFALLLGVVTGLVCGLAPAFAALRTNVNANLKEGGTQRLGGRRPRAVAFDAGGCGDCDCAGAADGLVSAAAQL